MECQALTNGLKEAMEHMEFIDGENEDTSVPEPQDEVVKSEGKPSLINKVFKQQCYIKDTCITRILLGVLLLASTWAVLYIIAGDDALPGGSLFILVSLVVTAYIVGELISFISLPPLLGMLITGVAFASFGIFNLSPEYKKVIPISRTVALNVILIKAGYGLDPLALRRLKWVVLKLALIPCVCEALAVSFISYYAFNLPWLWGLLLGPVSPAVVVPSLLGLKERGYGEDKGISTLVIAASSFDDILAISCFGVFLSLIFYPGGDLFMNIVKGPMEMIAGLAAGVVWGALLGFFPHRNFKHVVTVRVALLALGGLIATLGSKRIGFEGAGPLATITAAFICKLIWKLQSPETHNAKVAEAFSGFWLIMQPILFCLIGTEIDVTKLDGSTVGTGLVIIAFGLVLRIIVCFFVLMGGNLNWKEIIFISLAWVPKATVQAALSAQPLDAARSQDPQTEEYITRSMFLLTTAVVAILLTAPVGSIAISLTGPRLLGKAESANKAVNLA